ncbi:MAG: glycosyltransferase, partial [Acidobacteriota bacterium]|nr:glycosyltransferase [Acidobacteriota bacterium]
TLLVGPYPPPHGGISVHVRGLELRARAAGVPVKVLNSNGADAKLVRQIVSHSLQGWTVHCHTNGHNFRSWVIAGICGAAGRSGAGAVLTLHSGMVPAFLKSAPRRHRAMARGICGLYSRIVCVSAAIRDAIAALGVPASKIGLAEAFLGVVNADTPIDAQTLRWMNAHSPLLSTALFFRPEYGFEVLLTALKELRRRHPLIGCIVMGDSENRAVAEQAVHAAGLEKSILLMGDVEHDLCTGIMARSDIFVRPTLEDGDSVSVREALGLGVAVVASAVGTRPAGAHLFPAGDAAAMAASVQSAVVRRPLAAGEYA